MSMEKYGDILNKMQEQLTDLQKMMEEEQKNQQENVGSNHRSYTEEELKSVDLQKSEQEALTDSSNPDFYSQAAKATKFRIEYTGNTVTGPDGREERETRSVPVEVEARNFNQWSKSINDLDEEERKAIQKKAMMNIHYAEDKVGNDDIRTKIVNNKIQFVPKYSEEESRKRFKFTRVNEIDPDHMIPLCKFYINDELIFTMDVEKQARQITNPMEALEYKYASDNDDQEKMNEVDLLCREIRTKTGLDIWPSELPGFLDSGYLINGPLPEEKKSWYETNEKESQDRYPYGY